MKALFLTKRPDAEVTTKRNENGDKIYYVNNQTAFNASDVHNAENWLCCMESAYQRSKA